MADELITPRERFAGDILALAVAFGMKDRLDAKRIGIYWEALKDIPPPILTAGAHRCLQACQRFPAIAEWRRACDEVNSASLFPEQLEAPVLAQLPGDIEEADPQWRDTLPEYYACDQCRDTGFIQRLCQEGARCSVTFHICRQRPPEYVHTYVVLCPCRGDNPVIKRRIEERARLKGTLYGRGIEGVK